MHVKIASRIVSYRFEITPALWMTLDEFGEFTPLPVGLSSEFQKAAHVSLGQLQI